MLTREELQRGRKCVVYALAVDGDCEAADYLSGLQDSELIKLQAVIKRLADERFIHNRCKFNRLDGGIYELKLRNPPRRLFCFQDGPDWICTHGVRKPREKELKSHIAKVMALKRRYVKERM